MVAYEMSFNITLIKDIYNLSFSNTPIKLVEKLLAYFRIRKKTNLIYWASQPDKYTPK